MLFLKHGSETRIFSSVAGIWGTWVPSLSSLKLKLSCKQWPYALRTTLPILFQFLGQKGLRLFSGFSSSAASAPQIFVSGIPQATDLFVEVSSAQFKR